MPGLGEGKEGCERARTETGILRGRKIQGALEERGQCRGARQRGRHCRIGYVCRAGGNIDNIVLGQVRKKSRFGQGS